MQKKELINLIKGRRSIRQFQQKKLPREKIKDCLDAARLAPSASNLQPLEYFYIDDREKCDEIFPLLEWAGYIQPEGDPKPDQKPTGYLTVLLNKNKENNQPKYETGAAIENFMIAALMYGIGSCWLLSVDREKFREKMSVPDKYKIDSVVALGYPAEEPQIEEFEGSVEYWKDEKGQLHVPKRSLDNIININQFGDK